MSPTRPMLRQLSGRWPRRAGVVVLVWVAALVVGTATHNDLAPWRTLLVVALLGALAALIGDTVVDPAPAWHREHPGRDDWRDGDLPTASYVRLIENHLTSRSGVAVLRDRLVQLAEDVVRTRHGHEAAGIEQSDAVRMIRRLKDLPPEALTGEELARWLDRIEAL